jgi:hypothetical protein
MEEILNNESDLKSLLEKGLDYIQFQNAISKLENVFTRCSTLEYGGCIKVYKIVHINGLELMVHLLNIYAGSSIRNCKDYKGDLDAFAKENLKRVRIKTFVIDSSKRFHRMYLRKIKSM